MSKYPVFKGQMPILPTIITADGILDLESQKKLTDYCIYNNVGASEYQ